MNAKKTIEHGSLFPFDATDKWWNDDHDKYTPFPGDWSVIAARGVIADLRDRRDIKHTLQTDRIDEDVRAEIIQSLAEIIRLAQKEGDK
jgi:hypothetical protein